MNLVNELTEKTNKELAQKEPMDQIRELISKAFEVVKTAKIPKDIYGAVGTLTVLKDTVAKLKKAKKDATKDIDATIKEFDTDFKKLEKDIKGKFVELKDVFLATREKQVMDDETGEVSKEVKVVEQNNYKKGVFTFTPGKTELVVDTTSIIAKLQSGEATKEEKELYANFVEEKTVYELDTTKLNSYVIAFGASQLPTKTVKTDAKVGIQYAQVKKAIKEEKENGN